MHYKEVLGEFKKKDKFLIYSNYSKHVHDFNFELGQPRFKALPCHLLAVSPQANYITAQSRFPHIKIEDNEYLPFRVATWFQRNDTYLALNRVCGTLFDMH